jgi:Uncharacterized protein conserved in bacteria C-term(DUF2220).
MRRIWRIMIQRERKMMPKRIKRSRGLKFWRCMALCHMHRQWNGRDHCHIELMIHVLLIRQSRFMEPLLIRRHLSMQVRFRLQDAKELWP